MKVPLIFIRLPSNISELRGMDPQIKCTCMQPHHEENLQIVMCDDCKTNVFEQCTIPRNCCQENPESGVIVTYHCYECTSRFPQCSMCDARICRSCVNDPDMTMLREECNCVLCISCWNCGHFDECFNCGDLQCGNIDRPRIQCSLCDVKLCTSCTNIGNFCKGCMPCTGKDCVKPTTRCTPQAACPVGSICHELGGPFCYNWTAPSNACGDPQECLVCYNVMCTFRLIECDVCNSTICTNCCKYRKLRNRTIKVCTSCHES